jgi:hypothetical protein
MQISPTYSICRRAVSPRDEREADAQDTRLQVPALRRMARGLGRLLGHVWCAWHKATHSHKDLRYAGGGTYWCKSCGPSIQFKTPWR